MGDQALEQLATGYREGIRGLVDWSQRELIPELRDRVLEAVRAERERGEPVETYFSPDPDSRARCPDGFDQARRFRDQLAAADHELPPERVAELERSAFEGLAG